MPAPSIAFDITPLQTAHRFRGIGAYVRGLARRLADQSEVPLEFWGWEGELEFAPPAPHRLLLLPRFPMPQYRASWLFARLGMRLRARRSAVTAVHITDPEALTGLGRRTLLTTVYDLIPLREGVPRRKLLNRIGYETYLSALGRADVLFAISEQTATDLVELRRLPAKRMVIARPGIDFASAAASLRQDRPYFLFVGGPNPNKNLDVVVRAMKLCGELPEELLIAGRWLPKQLAAFDQRVQGDGLTGRVRHLGFVPDAELTRLMKDATALVVPSLLEGFGLPVGEGMAAGAAVIHSRLPILEETSRGAALMFDPHSPTELAECMRQVSRDAVVRGNLRKLAAERVTELTWDSAVENTLAAYRKLLA